MLFCIITSDDVSLLVMDYNLNVSALSVTYTIIMVHDNICMLEAFHWKFASVFLCLILLFCTNIPDAVPFLLWRDVRQRCWQCLADRILEDATKRPRFHRMKLPQSHRKSSRLLWRQHQNLEIRRGPGSQSVGVWPQGNGPEWWSGHGSSLWPAVYCRIGQWLGNWRQSIGNPGAISNVHGTVWAAQSTRES